MIRNPVEFDEAMLNHFVECIEGMRARGAWEKAEIVELFSEMIPEFRHLETGKYLDSKM